MSDDVRRPLQVHAVDFRLEVDGVPARVDASGGDVVVRSDHPLRLLRAALRARSGLPPGTGWRAVRRATGALRAAGLRVTVAGPRRTVVTLGARRARRRFGSVGSGMRT